MARKHDTLVAYSRARRGRGATGRWYYLERVAANGETLSCVRYTSRAGRNLALRRVLSAEPFLYVERRGPSSPPKQK